MLPLGCPETSVSTNVLYLTSQNGEELLQKVVLCRTKAEIALRETFKE